MASNLRRDHGAPTRSLLTADDPCPIVVVNPAGRSSFLLIGDHAGNRVPTVLGDLGISDEERARHIGWDIGIAALGEGLAGVIDAPFIRQVYSRLVIDCNRRPGAPDAIPPVSDGTAIPANAALSAEDAEARVAAIHAPYQAAIEAELARRDEAGMQTILVALHSFTPAMQSVARPWHIGILHDGGDPAFAAACIEVLEERGDLVVGDNEPYRMDLIDYTIPRHAYPARRPYVEIEIRQDLIGDDAGVARWTEIMAAVLPAAAARIG